MRSRDGLRCDGTLDIECGDWDKFAVAATYRPDHGRRIHHSIGALCDYLLSNPGIYWGHCAGGYDTLSIAEELRRRQLACTLDLSRGRVSRLVCGKLSIRDSWGLVPLRLDVAASIAGLPGPTLGLPCRCGLSCGGYCAIRAGDKRKIVSDYCADDCFTLWQIITVIFGVAESAGLVLRGTIGATAWASVQRELGLPSACDTMTPGIWRAAREAYYGGRIAIVRPRAHGPGSHWDISSAYPSALSETSVPTGEVDAYGADRADDAFERGAPGIYTCSVSIPATFLCPLPVRVGGRVAFPYGEFRGTWTRDELLRAVERGVEIRATHSALVWSNEERIFGDTIRRWYRYRRAAGKQSALGQWWRLVTNSLTGKLAESPERMSARMFPDEIRYCTLRRPCTVEHCTKACGAMEMIDLWGEIWGVPFYRLAPSGHVQWAACVTARTREVWLLGAESQGDDLIYGNTDSVWTVSRTGPTPRGTSLGSWERKGGWTEWECVGPSAYRYRDDDGGRVIRTSGMTITDEEWEHGEVSYDRGVMPFREAAKQQRGLFRRAHRTWTLPGHDTERTRLGDRILDETTGITYPLRYDEIDRRRKTRGSDGPTEGT